MKRNRITGALGALVFLSVFILNISVFVKSSSTNDGPQLKDFLLQASADDDSGDNNGSNLAWSANQSCDFFYEGSFRTCQKNGPGNSCTSEGATTCNCS